MRTPEVLLVGVVVAGTHVGAGRWWVLVAVGWAAVRKSARTRAHTPVTNVKEYCF